MANIIIEGKNLVKRYGTKPVLANVNIEVFEGECFGLLGPNGAGKTSLLRMIYGSSSITSGDLFVFGLNVRKKAKEIKAKLGVVPQFDGLDPDFTVQDNLLVFSRYYNMDKKKADSRVRELLQLMHLYDHANDHVDILSGGMQRRLAIARALLHDPSLLILDEPTTGLDPQARHWLWSQFEIMKQLNKTFLLTTHYMDEAFRLCDRIALVDHGKILDVDTPEKLITRHVGEEVVEFSCNEVDLNYHILRLGSKCEHQVLPGKLRLFIRSSQETQNIVGQITSDNLLMRKASLDDVFLKLAGYELRD